MSWKAIGVDRFRAYAEYQDILKNLTSVQELCTEQFLRIQELKKEIAEKDEMMNKLLAIAFITNPAVAKSVQDRVNSEHPSESKDQKAPSSSGLYPRLPVAVKKTQAG